MLKKTIKAILKYPIIAINRVYIFIYFNLAKKCEKYREIKANKKSNILVLAPHVDDETIGLGGTIIKYRNAGSNMSLVYMTDGSGSTSEKSTSEVIKERRQEGESVKKGYGFADLYFLDEIDGSLNANKADLIEKLKNIIDCKRPDIIFSPFLIDGNRDHTETTKTLSKALELLDMEVKVYLYEVNSLIDPKIVNAISYLNDDIQESKKDKYKIFKSQWAMGFSVYNLIDYGRGLNYGKGQRVEPFVGVDSKDLSHAIDSLEKNGFNPLQFKQISSEFTFLPGIIKNYKEKAKYNRILVKLLDK